MKMNRKKYKQSIMNKETKNLMWKYKIGKSLNANEQSLTTFYTGLTRGMYFRIAKWTGAFMILS